MTDLRTVLALVGLFLAAGGFAMWINLWVGPVALGLGLLLLALVLEETDDDGS